MKCKDVVSSFTETDRNSYSSEVISHLDKCENCRLIWEQQRFAVKMLSLKRHECRTQQTIEMAANAVCRSISEENNLNSMRFSEWGESLLLKKALPLAAALALVVTSGFVFIRGGSTDEKLVAETRLPVNDWDATTILVSQPEWMNTHTNTSPQHIQYGPLRSRLVDYEID